MPAPLFLMPALSHTLVLLPLSLCPVGACISNYIKDDRLTTLARAATWLGNDETHYVRQHPDYTLKELKAFADAFITFIDADLAYEAALKLVTP